MNLFLEYLRYPIAALILLCIPPGMVILAVKAMRQRNQKQAFGLLLSAALLCVPIGNFTLNAVGGLIMVAPPPGEASLVDELEKNMGVNLPATAKIISYRTAVSFFGEWGGMLRAKVPCRELGPFKAALRQMAGWTAQPEVLLDPQRAMLDVWRKSRFKIPAGSRVVVTDDGEFRAVYGVDPQRCTVHYQRRLIS